MDLLWIGYNMDTFEYDGKMTPFYVGCDGQLLNVKKYLKQDVGKMMGANAPSQKPYQVPIGPNVTGIAFFENTFLEPVVALSRCHRSSANAPCKLEFHKYR